MVDFVKLASTAKRLIDANGRTVKVRQVTDGAPVDPAKPWNPTTVAKDHNAIGVFLNSERSMVTGELIPMDATLVLLAAEGLAITPRGKDSLVDGTAIWNVQKVRTLKPADTALFHELEMIK